MGVRSKLRRKGFGRAEIKYIEASWRDSTTKQYDVYVRKWHDFCHTKNWDKHRFTVKMVVKFLVCLKDKFGLSYKSVAAARSAINNYAVMINSKNEHIMSHVVISRAMKGMANLHPQVRKYQQIWNPQQLLEYYRNGPENAEMSLRDLSCKVAALAALVTASRCQSVHLILRSKMDKSDDCYCCRLPSKLKTSKWGKPYQVLHLPKYPEPKICVYEAVSHYLDRTATLRAKNKDKLFIISRKPHTPASRDTVSGWIKCAMKKAGIDTSVYTTHSTRKASTSQALKSVPLATILKAAGWAGSQTFAQFYKLPVMGHHSFANAVLTTQVRPAHLND